MFAHRVARYLFQSAISRYLGSDIGQRSAYVWHGGCFNPLYRGTWVLTGRQLVLLHSCNCCFNPLYRGTWVLTRIDGTVCCWPCSFNPLYRGTWVLTAPEEGVIYIVSLMFQSAISRYLVSNPVLPRDLRLNTSGFNPLYRGTWFPTLPQKRPL